MLISWLKELKSKATKLKSNAKRIIYNLTLLHSVGAIRGGHLIRALDALRRTVDRIVHDRLDGIVGIARLEFAHSLSERRSIFDLRLRTVRSVVITRVDERVIRRRMVNGGAERRFVPWVLVLNRRPE